ncbi:hypothetical protein L7F22_004427 [Adiantum nelumboides]|nr:hypothetical protein [Adiantum nelumboides]
MADKSYCIHHCYKMISVHTPRIATPSSQGGDNECSQHVIAQHYQKRCNRTIEEREASPIIHLKKLHNWIKDVLIRMHAEKGNVVLDMACGKGGDLAKWLKAEVRLYVGVDIVESSLQQARKRYQELTIKTTNNLSALRHAYGTSKHNTKGFAAKFICADCFTDSLLANVRPHVPAVSGFDICSCQFALHYSWSTMGRARATMANVAALLKPGGYFIGTIPDSDVILGKLQRSCSGEFGNRLYKVKFDRQQHARALRHSEDPYGLQYEFHLEDAVDHCPEWLVPFDQLKKLAQQYGLELSLKKNFQDFVTEHMQVPDLVELMHKLDARGTISHEEWECVSIYLVFAFQKRPY